MASEWQTKGGELSLKLAVTESRLQSLNHRVEEMFKANERRKQPRD